MRSLGSSVPEQASTSVRLICVEKRLLVAVTNTYTVTGMTCSHCVQAVTGEISALPGVEKVQIDLASGALEFGDPLGTYLDPDECTAALRRTQSHPA